MQATMHTAPQTRNIQGYATQPATPDALEPA